MTIALTRLPSDYPHGFTFSEKAVRAGATKLEQEKRREANTAPYAGRGWYATASPHRPCLRPSSHQDRTSCDVYVLPVPHPPPAVHAPSYVLPHLLLQVR